MENYALDQLTLKLKNVPQNILECVIDYVDAIIEPQYNLSLGQQQILDSQFNSDKSFYKDAEELYSGLKEKYEL